MNPLYTVHNSFEQPSQRHIFEKAAERLLDSGELPRDYQVFDPPLLMGEKYNGPDLRTELVAAKEVEDWLRPIAFTQVRTGLDSQPWPGSRLPSRESAYVKGILLGNLVYFESVDAEAAKDEESIQASKERAATSMIRILEINNEFLGAIRFRTANLTRSINKSLHKNR